MTDSPTKQKQSRRVRFPIGCLALVLAVGLCVLFRDSVLSMRGFFGPCQSSVSYPLLLLTYDPPLRALAWTVVVLIFMLLIGAALARRVNAVLIVGAFLVGAGLLLNPWMSGPMMTLKPLQMLRHDESTYRLVYVSGTGVGVESTYPIRDFILLECDASVWGECDVVGSIDMTVGEYFKEPNLDTVILDFDETYQIPVLDMGDSVRDFIGCMLY